MVAWPDRSIAKILESAIRTTLVSVLELPSQSPELESITADVTLNLISKFFFCLFYFIQNKNIQSENKDCSVCNKHTCFLHSKMEGEEWCVWWTCDWFNRKVSRAAWIKLAYHSSKNRNRRVKKKGEKKKNLLSWNSNNNIITFYTGSAVGVKGWANCSFHTLPTWPAQLRQINEGCFSSTTKHGMVIRNRKVQVQCWLKIDFFFS